MCHDEGELVNKEQELTTLSTLITVENTESSSSEAIESHPETQDPASLSLTSNYQEDRKDQCNGWFINHIDISSRKSNCNLDGYIGYMDKHYLQNMRQRNLRRPPWVNSYSAISETKQINWWLIVWQSCLEPIHTSNKRNCKSIISSRIQFEGLFQYKFSFLML